jgi:hypothetical protein
MAVLIVCHPAQQVVSHAVWARIKSRSAAGRIMKEIEALRNDLAHAQDIVTRNWPQIARIARRVEESLVQSSRSL